MDLDKFFQSKIFTIIVWIIIGLILVLLVFRLGMSVGANRANFNYKWGENYYRNFAGPARKFPNNLIGPDDFMDAHGVFGQVIKVDESALVIKDRNKIEKNVLISNKTTLRNGNQDINLKDIKIDDKVVVIGEPDDQGQIMGRLIRILPPIPSGEEPRPIP